MWHEKGTFTSPILYPPSGKPLFKRFHMPWVGPATGYEDYLAVLSNKVKNVPNEKIVIINS